MLNGNRADCGHLVAAGMIQYRLCLDPWYAYKYRTYFTACSARCLGRRIRL